MLPTIINRLVFGYSSNTEVEIKTVYDINIIRVVILKKNNTSFKPMFMR